ncbi:TIR domain-containing protein [Endothiovibrio diazotrophicus]
MAHQIFISLTHRDTPIADALSEAIRDVFGGLLSVNYSTSNTMEGGIPSGADWFQWIVNQVNSCDIALILVTPNSVQKPWIMWESGAVYGAAVAQGEKGVNKVRPLVYQLRTDEIPSPIRDSKTQYLNGDDRNDITRLLRETTTSLIQSGALAGDAMWAATSNLDTAVANYLKAVDHSLLNAPALPTGNVVEEWRHRLDQIAEADRMSEVEQLHRWMDITFGLEEGEPQAIDLRIHARLGEIYLKARNTKQAIAQLKLARRLAPRDIYVLRMLGKAYLDDRDSDEAWNIIKRINELDPQAKSRNSECAALEGRWLRENGLHRDAGEVFKGALRFNPDSYYLANLAGEAFLAAGEHESAREYFQQAADIVSRLNEKNVWALATKANALLAVHGITDQTRQALDAVRHAHPSAGEKESILRGLSSIAEALPDKPDVTELMSILG